MQQTSGHILTEFRTLIGKASRIKIAKTWPAPMFCTVVMAALVRSGSFPSCRIRHGPEASVKATPNLIWGDEPARISYRSSAVLMKCVWPRIIFAPSGISTRTVLKSIPAPHARILNEMIRHYAAMGLQLLGLILTGEALLLYFGQMGPLLKTASMGAGLFYAGRIIQPRKGK